MTSSLWLALATIGRSFCQFEEFSPIQPELGGSCLIWAGLSRVKYVTNIGLNSDNILPRPPGHVGTGPECGMCDGAEILIFCHNYLTYRGLPGASGQIFCGTTRTIKYFSQ